MAAIKALEQWCKVQCEGYRDVAISNMTTSFRNGLAFCALIHKHRPDLIDYDSLRKEDVFENNRLAFQIAEETLGIPALLDAEDMVALRIPDRLSILTYVSQYHNYFKGRPPVGGMKRPAEGSKEEPSEKKNHPVVAKIFERGSPSVRSPNAAEVSAHKVPLTDTANKSGTLSSKCVACQSHVHLVQRHFVEGKLYHRSCFKCNECSSTLHAGSYKPGKNVDTFVCNTHHNGSKTSSLESDVKNGVSHSAVQPRPQEPQAQRFSSVLSAPVNAVLKPSSPNPQSQSWTTSAQKTQAARQKFFQAAPQVTEASAGIRKPVEQVKIQKAHLGSDKNSARLMTGRKLAEENCNNNNGHQFTIRPAARRFVADAASVDVSLRKDKSSQDPTGSCEGPNRKSPRPIGKDTRPTTEHKPAKAAKKGKYLSPNTFRPERRSSVKSHGVQVEQIEEELEDIELKLGQLEREGVELEKKLRSCEDKQDGDLLMDPLMVDWFNLIRKKQMYVRKESELVYIARTQELERQQPGVEGELRRLLEKPDHLKCGEERQQEKKLMQRLMEIVNGRNVIVEVLDEDRRREVEEDQQLNKMMQDLGVKKTKTKRKSSISKMFRRSKRKIK
ncbi:MICAL-like protein 2a [Nematolebias whitei]|uniref:MICAL-like protein 2a n=1 Tax=Nematolebias whitei TaxID=451745 RepID=UPI00189A795D|nr:MICAL-like protein 2a [Nematolebias whitei]